MARRAMRLGPLLGISCGTPHRGYFWAERFAMLNCVAAAAKSLDVDWVIVQRVVIHVMTLRLRISAFCARPDMGE